MSVSSRPSRKEPAERRPSADLDRGPDMSGRGVEFLPGPEPVCAAMRALAGKRLLYKDAPLLPLPGCGQPTCRCQYKLHADRRAGARRWGEVGFKVTETRYRQPFLQRRSPLPGRRKTDPSR